MEPVDLYSYYRLGAAMNELLDISADPAPDFGSILIKVFEAQTAVEVLETSALEHSKSAGKDVVARLYALTTETRDPEGKIDFNKPLQSFRIANMKQAVRDLQTILTRECPTLPIFFVPQKGYAKTDELIDRAEKDFPEPIRSSLPAKVIEEIRQAGKALAFDLFTAYSFHMMRAAELIMLDLLRDYYNKPIKESDRNWGNYINIIRTNGGDPELVRYLNEMARIERNEGIHPTKLLNEVEADMRYTVAKGAIIAMVRDLQNRSFYDGLIAALTATSTSTPPTV